MSDLLFAAERGRTIPKEDVAFGVSSHAKAAIAAKGRENVIDATIGVLLDDDGKLIVLSSVDEVFKSLTPDEYAAYAPISGIPTFREAVKKAALGNYAPKGFVEAVATPGGTGAIRNTVSNYTDFGDYILVPDWYWGPYKTIATEIGRNITTFPLLTDGGRFNTGALRLKLYEVLNDHERTVLIINTPAHNPTGYALSDDDWKAVIDIVNSMPKGKKITLLVDSAYIDFAGETDETRSFFPLLEQTKDNVLPVLAYSLSKTFTIYGMRAGAMICFAKTAEEAEEFKLVNEFSSRGSWSNCNRAPQVILSKIYDNEELKARVDRERAVIRDMLLARGRAFEQASKECGLDIVPFKGGFFCAIPCKNPKAVQEQLEKMDVYLIPFAKGVRVSIASVSEETARRLPAMILEAKKIADK